MIRFNILLIAFAFALLFSASLFGAKLVGKVESVSRKAKLIQFKNPKSKKVYIVKFNDKTKLVEVKSFKALKPGSKVSVEVDKKGVATSIKLILVKVPAEKRISTKKLSKLMEDGEDFFLGDARPPGKCGMGHLPGAINTFSKTLKKNMHLLPKDKNKLLVFYCGGPSCPLSPNAAKLAEKSGYKNVKVYVDGMPAWKKSKRTIEVDPSWLKKRLNVNHVIVDLRDSAEIAKGHIPGAIQLSYSELKKLNKEYKSKKLKAKKKRLFGIRDKKAPIIFYMNGDKDKNLIASYKILAGWKYKSAAVLMGGFSAWTKLGFKVKKGRPALTAKYVKKIEPGSATDADFISAARTGNKMIIDVRAEAEAADGVAPYAINIPLDQLKENLHRVPKKGGVILYCTTGSRACMGYNTFKKAGYKNITYLNDQFDELLKAHNMDTVSVEKGEAMASKGKKGSKSPKKRVLMESHDEDDEEGC
jgi:rhodanese-related sulfurtransferase